MARCSDCGTRLDGETAFTCNFCDAAFCPEHRLPERHGCEPFQSAERSQQAAAGLAPEGSVSIGESDDDNDPPERTPCEECGRPCPADQTYCSPCQADFRDMETTATREEIAEHWRKNDDLPPEREPPNRKRWLLIALVLGAIALVAAWVLGII
jgi:hypothetical protein